MKHLGRSFVLIYIFTINLIVNCEEDVNYFEDTINSEELINPHSFYYDKQNKKMIKNVETDMNYKDTSKIDHENTNEMSVNFHKTEDIDPNTIKVESDQSLQLANNFSAHEAVFYKRLINLLLTNIHIQDKNEVSLTGLFEIEISHSDMEILQNFKAQKTSLREVDEILSNSIKKPRYNYKFGISYILDLFQTSFYMIFNIVQEHPHAFQILFAMLMICFTLRRIKWDQRLPIVIIIQVVFVLSFFMTWWHLIQEAEIEYAAAQMRYAKMPISCQPDKMSMWDKFISFFSNDDCEQYYRTVMSNPKLKITPALAFSHFITTVILHPLTQVGTFISEFINNATDNLPWTYGWVVRLMFFLCVGIVIIMIPFFLFGASINFGLGLLRFGISYPKKNEKGNSLQNIEKREPIQIILQLQTQDVTNTLQIKDSTETEQSKAPLAIKNDCGKEITATENQEFYGDLSCGDAIKNNELLKDDDETMKCKQFDVVKKEEHDGSGDA